VNCEAREGTLGCIHEADGLYQAVPVPYPDICSRFKVNETAVMNLINYKSDKKYE